MKSTHTGECQICGSRQALPGGALSKHGYTTRWGFFSGVCAGAGYLPFEQSTDQIAAAVARVEQQILDTEAEAKALEDVNSEVNQSLRVWVTVYTPWGKVPAAATVVDFVVRPTQDTGYSRDHYSASYRTNEKHQKSQTRPADFVTERIEAYDKSWDLPTPAHWACFLNTRRASALRQTNSSRRDWLRWQAERLANWSVKPLTPRA